MRRRLEPIDAFADHLQQPDVAGGGDVRAAAQLDRRPGFEHADDVAVLVAEEGDRAHRLGLGLGGLEHPRPLVAQRLGVDQPLDLGDLLVGDRLVVREVEPQPVGADVRAGLLDVIAEHPAQRPVQQVRAGVVAADGLAAFDVDRRRRRLAGRDLALDQAHRRGAAGSGRANVVSSTSARPVSVTIVPVSPTWPPDSA